MEKETVLVKTNAWNFLLLIGMSWAMCINVHVTQVLKVQQNGLRNEKMLLEEEETMFVVPNGNKKDDA